jgi:hypothetical protein
MTGGGRAVRRRSLLPGRWSDPELRPAYLSGLLRGGRMVRVTLAAALLALAAGVLYTDGPAAPCPSPAKVPPAAPDGTAPPELPAPPAGLVGVAVRLADPAALAVVQPGSRVDLLAVDADGDSRLLATEALVLDVVGADTSPDGYPALYLALRPDQARPVAAAPEMTRFTILIR